MFAPPFKPRFTGEPVADGDQALAADGLPQVDSVAIGSDTRGGRVAPDDGQKRHPQHDRKDLWKFAKYFTGH